MRIYFQFIFVLSLTVLASCNSNNHFKIVGKVNNMPVQKIKLRELNIEAAITDLDSTTSKPDGSFVLSGLSKDGCIYQVITEQSDYYLISADKSNISFEAEWNNPNSITINGSPATQSLAGFLKIMRSHVTDINTLNVVIDSFQAQHKDSLVSKAKNDIEKTTQNLTEYIENYADTTAFIANALLAVRVLNPASEQKYLDKFSKGLESRFKNSTGAKNFVTLYNKKMNNNSIATQSDAQTPSNDGIIAPDFTVTTPEGTPISLASFKGKYVLLDFWASWCGPCRGENPNVVSAFEQFKDKNFTVFSVSLDDNKERWVNAIKEDHLTWSNGSDLKKWESNAAKLYQIESIPSNFLIDPNGKVIGKDLRGNALVEKLAATLK